MSNQRELLAQATAARLIQDRLRFVAIIELCSIEIRAKDKILGSVAPMLTTAAFGEIYGEHERQDARLQRACSGLYAHAEPRDEIQYEPDPDHPGSLREVPQPSQKTEQPKPSES